MYIHLSQTSASTDLWCSLPYDAFYKYTSLLPTSSILKISSFALE